ncbi:MAG TPA: endopeptidase La [Acidobacteriota bacterium]|nr:endopeptidase La [Acidobacteriota bacterium]HNT16996.1 endopeptidase La [Acidobacteriota bacterium]HPA26786.1 endopeptidase La [Acidobacteriota bacterium]HQO20978.1 endopeptidase La [Acidobacteriota bacterium]HQQ47443.1 endopeptidase La [Acidobacteriota bacterium]
MAEDILKDIIEEKPVYPVLPLRNTILYPGMIIPLAVGRDRSLKALEQATRQEGLIFIVSQKDGDIEDPAPTDLYGVGVVGKLLRLMRSSPTNLAIVVQGQSKAKIEEVTATEPYLEARLQFLENTGSTGVEAEALKKNILMQYEKFALLTGSTPQEQINAVKNYSDPDRIVDTIAYNFPIPLAEKQLLLEETDTLKRLKLFMSLLARELQVVELGSKIQSEVMDSVQKSQKDYFLKEQIKAIQRELGEDTHEKELEVLKERIIKAKMPKETEAVALKELNRLSLMHPSAAEYSVSRTYLDWLIELPWNKHTKDRLDVKRAQAILDEDHYGLKKVKDRIIEYLAVQQLKKDLKGPILCLVGPPGVGKTSLGKSVARSLGRKFIRMSLGGIKDEAEIRGHRRTYVAALPGRIIQGIRKTGSKNPVFMLDELDKVGMDFRGDPTSALLEVLDPEQNNSFSDHYLEVPFDLSQTMFIATANILETIPQPLLDRTEVIRLPGYTEEEKLHIATDHVIPRVLKNNGLTKKHIEFTEKAIRMIINEYTREAGVRNLERQLSSISRKVAKERVSGNKKKVSVTEKLVREYLGMQQVFLETRERIDRPGVSTGLAWTPFGGDILFIECTTMKGKGGLMLTGQLGDVMKESAHAALSWIKSHAAEFGISEKVFFDRDIHLHVPAGATPKDGPSAGVAIVTSLTSILTGKIVRDDLAMTGEISLVGKVLPVGGVKEKVLAAKRAQITDIILPDKNKGDLEDLTDEVKKSLNFHFVNDIHEALDLVFVKKTTGKKGKKG